jgi:hypothetical protein
LPSNFYGKASFQQKWACPWKGHFFLIENILYLKHVKLLSNRLLKTWYNFIVLHNIIYNICSNLNPIFKANFFLCLYKGLEPSVFH